MTKRFTDANGVSKTVDEWYNDPRCVVSRNGLEGRLERGWSVEDALTKARQARILSLPVDGRRTWLGIDGDIVDVAIPAFAVQISRDDLSNDEVLTASASAAVAVASHAGTLGGIYCLNLTFAKHKLLRKTSWIAVIPDDPDPKQIDPETAAWVTKIYFSSKRSSSRELCWGARELIPPGS